MKYDVIIIGAGPAGLTCGLYLKRANKNIVIFEKEAPGGKLSKLHEINNYPGITSIDGASLAYQMYQQALDNKIDIIFEEVIDFNKQDDYYIIKTPKSTYESKMLVYAGGVGNNKLNVKGEQTFFNKGISYCVTCDGALYKNRPIVYIYKGNHEVEYEITYLKNITNNLIIIDLNNINNKVIEFSGTNKLEKIIYQEDGITHQADIDGAFINLGLSTDTKLTLDNNIYVIGDAASHPLKQIVVACSDGAIAASSIIKKLK